MNYFDSILLFTRSGRWHSFKINSVEEFIAKKVSSFLPSMSVFSNFPGQNLNLKRVNCIDFSLNGGYYSIGNNRGAANLFRLKHFGSFWRKSFNQLLSVFWKINLLKCHISCLRTNWVVAVLVVTLREYISLGTLEW